MAVRTDRTLLYLMLGKREFLIFCGVSFARAINSFLFTAVRPGFVLEQGGTKMLYRRFSFSARKDFVQVERTVDKRAKNFLRLQARPFFFILDNASRTLNERNRLGSAAKLVEFVYMAGIYDFHR